MANTWILIRHPDKKGDKEKVYLGDTAEITELGMLQIKSVTKRIKELGPTAITCSVLPRTVSLAKHIAAELNITNVVQHGFFNEVHKPQFLVGLKRDDPRHIEVMRAIRDQFDEDTVPEHLLQGEKIETRSELEARVRKAFDFVEKFQPSAEDPDASCLLTVTHAKFIAAVLQMMICNSLKEYYERADRAFKISTTGITILSRVPNRRTREIEWQITTVNEEAHVENIEMQSLLDAIH